MDEEQPEMRNLDLDDALKLFSDQHQEPDGFLMRLVIFDDDDVDMWGLKWGTSAEEGGTNSILLADEARHRQYDADGIHMQEVA